MQEFKQMNINDERRPYGLGMNRWSATPTLKRGANNHCAYGAGGGHVWSALARVGRCRHGEAMSEGISGTQQ
jgi:hypothetical protein